MIYSYNYNIKPRIIPNKETLSSYYFNGTNKYITLGNVLGGTIEGNNKVFSIGIVFRRLRTGADFIFSNWNTTGNQRSLIMNFSSTNTIKVQFSSDGAVPAGNWESTGTITDTNWHELILSYNNGVVTVHLDGNSYAGTSTTIPTTLFTSSADVLIGAINAGATTFNGWINQAFITNDVIPTNEALSMWNGGSPRRSIDVLDNIVSAYLFDDDTWDGSNWTVIDSIGSNNGTSVNMIAVDRDNNENPY
jgi:hypothetical protein